MNEKTEKQLNTIITEQEKEIERLNVQSKEIKKRIKELTKDNLKLKSLFRTRDTKREDDIITGMVEQ